MDLDPDAYLYKRKGKAKSQLSVPTTFQIALDLNAWAISESSLIPDQNTEEEFLESRWYGIVNWHHFMVDYGWNINQMRH